VLALGVGFYAVPVLVNVLAIFDATPQLEGTAYVTLFQTWFFGGSMWAFFACALGGVRFFFMQTRRRFIYLLAPIYGPLIWALSVLVYFTMII